MSLKSQNTNRGWLKLVNIKRKREKKMVEARGCFIRRGDNIFRTQAYIQWGNSTVRLGTVLMLNPGRAKLQVYDLPEDEPIEGVIDLDPTMETLIQLIEEMYQGGNLEGRVYIYNLFTLRNSKSKEAIMEFERIYQVDKELLCGFPKKRQKLLEEIKQTPWFLIGWGCGEDTERLRHIKEEWLEVIKEAGVPILGKKGRSEYAWYHPRPQLLSNQILYREEIIKQYQQLTKRETIVDQSWMRHVNNYQPVEKYKIGPYFLALYEIDETEYIINYRYRLLCFYQEYKAPVLALNYEWSSYQTICFGASVAKGHINLGQAPEYLSLQQFRNWALKLITTYIKDIDPKEVYKILEDNESRSCPVKDEKLEGKIKNLLDERKKQIIKRVREFKEYYEYCIVESYEECYEDFEVHMVPLKDIGIVLLQVGEEIKFVAIQFTKKEFNIDKIYTWMQLFEVYFNESTKQLSKVKDCGQILEGIRFKEHLLLIHSKGNQVVTVDSNEYEEITNKWDVIFEPVDTGESKPIVKGLCIKLNGEILEEVPYIEINQPNDILISNGNLIVADYIDEYCGGIGIYRNDDPCIPVAFFLDNNTTIEIEIYTKEDKSKICVIEHRYIIDVESL